MRPLDVFLSLSLLATCALAPAQVQTDTRPSVTAPDIIPLGPLPPLDPQADELLKLLHDRKDSLKDFTAKLDYSVYHPLVEETGGKRGTVDFIMDPTKGPIFTVDFTVDTSEGKARAPNHQQIIFDGVNVTIKDFTPKQYLRNKVLPDGAKPGSATTLGGPLPLPIGLDPVDVARDFIVTLQPAKDPNFPALRLIPRILPPAGKYTFKQLDIIIDKKLQLPVEITQTAPGKGGDITTYKLTDIEPNTAKARMQNPLPPENEHWTERKEK